MDIEKIMIEYVDKLGYFNFFNDRDDRISILRELDSDSNREVLNELCHNNKELALDVERAVVFFLIEDEIKFLKQPYEMNQAIFIDEAFLFRASQPEYYSLELLKLLNENKQMMGKFISDYSLTNNQASIDISVLLEKNELSLVRKEVLNNFYLGLLKKTDEKNNVVILKKMEENIKPFNVEWSTLLKQRSVINQDELLNTKEIMSLWNLNAANLNSEIIEYYKSYDFYPGEREKEHLISTAIKTDRQDIITAYLLTGLSAVNNSYEEKRGFLEKIITKIDSYSPASELIRAFFEKHELNEIMKKPTVSKKNRL